MTALRLGTRNSKLALVQAEHVACWLRERHQGLEVEIVGLTTQGDQILDKKLDKIGGKGLFIKELEQALLENRVDFAVHSAKDLPAQLASGLELMAVSAREDASDALVGASSWQNLPLGAVIGTSSSRRELQLLALRPDLQIRMLRGNVLTRLEKLRAGSFHAIVLASAGLIRLGLAQSIGARFSAQEMVPAVGQGVLAIEARSGFSPHWFHGFHDEQSWFALQVERSCMVALQGDCSTPLGVHVHSQGCIHAIEAFYGKDGRSARVSFQAEQSCPQSLGQQVAARLLSQWENLS